MPDPRELTSDELAELTESVREQMIRELLMGVLGMTPEDAAESGCFTDTALSPREMAELEDELLASWPPRRQTPDARKA